jgi:hypothetical protein
MKLILAALVITAAPVFLFAVAAYAPLWCVVPVAAGWVLLVALERVRK